MTKIGDETYVGNFLNGKKDGKGVLEIKLGDKYEGEFVYGEKHGKGTLTR